MSTTQESIRRLELELDPNPPTPHQKLITTETIKRMANRVHTTHNRNCDIKINDCECFLAETWRFYLRLEMHIFIDFNICENKDRYPK